MKGLVGGGEAALPLCGSGGCSVPCFWEFGLGVAWRVHREGVWLARSCWWSLPLPSSSSLIPWVVHLVGYILSITILGSTHPWVVSVLFEFPG